MEDKTPDVLGALRSVLERLLVLAVEDGGLRAGLRDLGRAILTLAEGPPAGGAPPATAAEEIPTTPPEPIDPAPPPTTAPMPASSPAPAIQSAPAPVEPSVVELAERLFKPSPSQKMPSQGMIEPAPRHAVPITDEGLPVIKERCRLKAEASHWSAARRRRLLEGADFYAEIEPGDRELIAQAKALPECFLWMCHRDGPAPTDLALYTDVARAFEAAALAAKVLIGAAATPVPADLFAQALCLGAEAQSALRVAVAAIGAQPDNDQFKLFLWIRETAAERGIWIERHMRQDDPADAAGWSARLERLRALEEKFRRYNDRDKRQRKLFSKIRYHAKRIQEHPGTEDAGDWQTIVQSVEALVQDGVPASNVEIRDLLLPMLDAVPEGIELPKHFLLVLREVDRYLQLAPTSLDARDEAAPAPEVQRTAELLRGRAVVLIGGDHRPHAARALENAFGLKEVIWIEAWDQSYLTFDPEVANPDVALVLLAIRWSRHGFSEVKELCDKHRKPLVRLPGGYNPNQVAYHILHQVGDRLAAQTTVASHGRSHSEG